MDGGVQGADEEGAIGGFEIVIELELLAGFVVLEGEHDCFFVR